MRLRPERVAHMIRREIAGILERKLRDPRLGHWISVTDVEVTHDLASAKVFVSLLSSGEERERQLAVLRGAAGFVRHELAAHLDLREVPELRFIEDTSIERGARVDELLRRLERGEPIPDDDTP